MKTTITAFLFSAVLIAAAEAETLPLAIRGWPGAFTYAIIVPEGAHPAVGYAAEELRDFTLQMTGIEMPIVTNAASRERGGPGFVPAAGTAGASLPEKAVVLEVGDGNEESFRLHAEGNRLVITGGGPRGVLYGVYELLERFGGCRWYASWHSVIPHRERFEVPDDLDLSGAPAFAMRCPFWFDAIRNDDFAARLRMNTRFLSWEPKLDERHGGDSFRFGLSGHSFKPLCPPDKYFKDHPEYFSLLEGRRSVRQLCLSNPDVLAVVTSNLLERIRRNPGAVFYHVSQNDDSDGYCRCPACAAVDEEEGSPSGSIIRFVNAVAETVEKDYPDVRIMTFAYTYSRRPPKKTRARRNVVVQLCDAEFSFSTPLSDQKAFRDDIEGWGRMADTLCIWDYAANFTDFTLPFCNVFVLQDNLRFFRDNNVKYVFEQGDFKGRHGDLAELKTWLLSKLMWNPDLPLDALLDDFLAGYYGKEAAPYIRTYIEEISRRQRRRGMRMFDVLRLADTVSNAPDALEPHVGFPPNAWSVPDSFSNDFAHCWRMAAKAVREDPALSYNVRMSAFSFDCMMLDRLRHAREKVLCLAPETDSAAFLAKAQPLAQSLLDRMDEAKDICLAENGNRAARKRRELEELAARKPLVPADSGEIEDIHLSLAPLDGTYGCYVFDEKKAGDGCAIKLFGRKADWSVRFPLRKLEFEPGAKYKVRVCLRAEKTGEGRAFAAGIYNEVSKKSSATVEFATSRVSEDYAWYDIATWTPSTDDFLWIGPGRYDRNADPAVKNIFIDKIAFEKAE